MNVLFVCEGNVIRSQMAEAFLRRYAPDVSVKSAGTGVPARREGTLASEEYPHAVPAMKEIGFDISGALSKKLTTSMLEDADRVILVGPVTVGETEALRAHSGFEEWGVPDPGYGDADVREARDVIHQKVKQLAAEIQPQG